MMEQPRAPQAFADAAFEYEPGEMAQACLAGLMFWVWVNVGAQFPKCQIARGLRRIQAQIGYVPSLENLIAVSSEITQHRQDHADMVVEAG